MATTNIRKYPVGVVPMFFVQLLSMVPYSFITYLLVLYTTNQLDFTTKHAYLLVAAFVAIMYGAHVLGGYLAERFFGHSYAVTAGIVISTIGSFTLLLPSEFMLYVSLSLFIVGSGLLIPCLFVLLGRLYERDSPYRTSGFVFIYVGMNVGSFIATAAAGPLLLFSGYKVVFLIGGIFQIILLFTYLKYRDIFIKNAVASDYGFFNKSDKIWGWVISIIAVVIIAALLDYARVANALLIVLGILGAIVVAALALREKEQARRNLFAFLILTIIALCFWSLYLLNTSALVIFTEHAVNRHFSHWIIPTASFSSLNPLFIMIFGPVLAFLWNRWGRWSKMPPSIPTKFSIGLILAGLGFLLLVLGIHLDTGTALVSMGWVVLCYLLLTIGELMVSPVGFAMVGKLVPARMEAYMVGIWELSTGIAGAISGYLAYLTVKPVHATAGLVNNNLPYEHSFIWFGGLAFVVGIILIFFIPWLNRLCATR